MTVVRTFGGFLRSAGMQKAVSGLEAAMATRGGVLICGEPGTGREAAARAIHNGSHAAVRARIEDLLRNAVHGDGCDVPFVVLDCAGAANLEQSLFGCCRQTTGDDGLDRVSHKSVIWQSLGGTLFLRSVQEMPVRTQVRLARILRDAEVWVDAGQGEARVMALDIRIIASIEPSPDSPDDRITPELQKRVTAHCVELPPLRERREDIPALVRALLGDICISLRIPPKHASRQAVALMAALPWRGNLKEMRGLLRALVLKVQGPMIRLKDVLDNVRLNGGALAFLGGGTLKEARERFEREYVAAVLEQHHGRMAEAARALGLQRTNLYRKVKQLSVHRRRPRTSVGPSP